MPDQSQFFKNAGPLLLVLFIDGMGLGLVFPILNALIFDPETQFISGWATTPFMQNLIYGLIIGLFMFCWFFGAAILGNLSDQVGRKKSLTICLIGSSISYLLSAIAVALQSLTLLIIGRIIAGLTAGSQPIAQAAIVDLSLQEHKARNISYILLAMSLGFVFGPLFGGILSDNQLVSWFNFGTPFYFAAIISLLNVILLSIFFNETFFPTQKSRFALNPYQAIEIFISAFKNEKVRNLSIIFFIFIFGWSSFYSFISLFLLKIFNFTPTKVSIFMAVMGVGFGIGNGFLVGIFTKRFSLENNFIFSILPSAIIIFLMVALQKSVYCWLMIIPLAACVSLAYSALLTLFSNQVDKHAQGWVMGITGSIMAFVFGLDGILIGIIATWSANLPILIAAVSLGLSVVAFLFLYRVRYQI